MKPTADERHATQGRTLAVSLGLIGAALGLAYGGADARVALMVLAAGAVAVWWLPAETNVLLFIATLAVQVVQPLFTFRVAVSDLFMVPAIVRTGISQSSKLRALNGLSLAGPCALLLAAFSIATLIGTRELGGPTVYALVNKDIGIIYLVAAFFALVYWLPGREPIIKAVHLFVVGVSVANAGALLGCVVALAGIENQLYLTGNMRLYGWMLNPNLFGSVVMTAALLEMSMLGETAIRTRGIVLLRWSNLCLLAISLALTLSRGTWLAATAGTAALFMLQLFRTVRPNRGYLWVIGIGATTPAIALVVLASASRVINTDNTPRSSDYASALRERFIVACRSNPGLQICDSVQMPTERGELPGTSTDGLPELLPAPSGDGPNGAAVAVSLTNTRGLDDRFAILGVAGAEYLQTWPRIAGGIGLGTFYATSAVAFGIPLIIHNTFAWFLFELGPLGFIAVTWIWVTVARNLWRAYRAGDWRLAVTPGACAAFVALTVFCLLNEGFYQRHLWFLFALSDRLAAVRPEAQAQVKAVA